ncbi:MAG: hypothetical protein ACR2ML_00780 [Solirubrobacteraceae bacterium]
MEERSDVHTALADMERKLGELQRELTGEEAEEGPGAPPGLHATATPPAPAPPPPSAASPRPFAAPSPPSAAVLPPAAAPPPPAAAPPPPAQALLRAGPFIDIESLGRFEQTLRALDRVEEVVLRGFEADRALFDVRLAARR